MVVAKHIALMCQGALEPGKDQQVRETVLLQSAVLLGKVEGYHKAHNDASSSHQEWPSGKGTVRCRLLKSSKYQKSRHLGPNVFLWDLPNEDFGSGPAVFGHYAITASIKWTFWQLRQVDQGMWAYRVSVHPDEMGTMIFGIWS